MSEQGRCATCRYWQRLDPPKNDPDWGTCRRAEVGDDGRPVIPGTLAYASGNTTIYGEHDAELHTSSRFGCVQWEERREMPELDANGMPIAYVVEEKSGSYRLMTPVEWGTTYTLRLVKED